MNEFLKYLTNVVKPRKNIFSLPMLFKQNLLPLGVVYLAMDDTQEFKISQFFKNNYFSAMEEESP